MSAIKRELERRSNIVAFEIIDNTKQADFDKVESLACALFELDCLVVNGVVDSLYKLLVDEVV